MSMRYQAAILTASYFPLKTPNAPTAATATAISSSSASVAFTPPTDVGGGAITGYTVLSSGGQTATGSASPITVTGLTVGVSYTFVVFATNSFGTSSASAPSNSVSPIAEGQQAYTTVGTYSWIAPANVTSVSVVAVGGGGGGAGRRYTSLDDASYYNGRAAGGGGLGYKNNIAVVPGNAYTVVVGAGGFGGPAGTIDNTTSGNGTDGADSYFISTSTVKGGGGIKGDNASDSDNGGTYTGDGGGNGGSGGTGGNQNQPGTGGGGAGGYSGAGGTGATNAVSATSGSGGAGGGGGRGGSTNAASGGGGGGVGLLGSGSNGSAGSNTAGANGGGGGSSGGNGSANSSLASGPGGLYGGGGGGAAGSSSTSAVGGAGGRGAVRIIWPGTTRQFPSTNTGDV